jgi:formylmethanofuran dehydrogenase subunit D
MTADEYKSLGIAEGDKLVLTPRRARVFVEAGQGI